VLVEKMVGRELKDFYPKADVQVGEPILDVENVGLAGVFQGINFQVRAGEVLGLAGLVGAGRTDIGQSIFGIRPYTSGEIRYLGKRFEAKHPSEALEAGMAYLGEDRKELGIIPEMSIRENMTLGLLRMFQKMQAILFQAEKKATEDNSDALHIRMAHSGQKIQELSGGNQQKVLFGRMLLNMPNLLILDEPTNDLDLDTLQLLEDFLSEFQGCLLLVSHDRYFMDNLVDQLILVEGEGEVKFFNGNYTDYRISLENQSENTSVANKPSPVKAPSTENSTTTKVSKLSFKEQKEFEVLEKEIQDLEQSKEGLIEQLNAGHEDFQILGQWATQIEEIKNSLEEKEARWLELSEK
jgi:ABC-type sugar transport system ATPase subunit